LIFGQNTFSSDYMVLSSGDTIWGSVKNANGVTFNSLSFTTNNSTVICEQAIDSVKSIKVNNEFFVKAVLINEDVTSSARIEGLKSSDTIFLKQLVFGDKSLFSYSEGNGSDVFFININGNFQKLTNKELLANNLVFNDNFIKQLEFYFFDCPNISTYLSKVKYDELSLIQAFAFYYKCYEKEINHTKDDQFWFSVGVVGGVSFSSLIVSEEAPLELSSAIFSNSYDPAFGVFFDVLFLRLHGHLSLYNELLFSSFYVTGDFSKYSSNIEFRNDYYYEIGQSTIKLNNMLRYRFFIKKYMFFTNVGISSGLAVYQKNNVHKYMHYPTFDRESDGMAVDSPGKLFLSYTFGGGVRYDNFSLEARYERGNCISNSSGVIFSSNSYYLLFGYKF